LVALMTGEEHAARRAILDPWITDHPALEWIPPTGGVTGFPRVRSEVPVAANWHTTLLAEHGVLVGPGHWFDQS
jgi:aspartate/methionine/tyrosine aminotransferase